MEKNLKRIILSLTILASSFGYSQDSDGDYLSDEDETNIYYQIQIILILMVMD